MNKYWRICVWGVLAIVLLFALILLVGSPVAKYVVNNYGEDIVGRKLHADQIVINPFSGGVTISDFECKEKNGTMNFVSFTQLYVQVAYPQLIAKHAKIRAIHLDGFSGQIVKDSTGLNITDIIERFSKDSTEQPQDTTPSSWTVALDDIRINNSAIRYRDVEGRKQWKLEDISLHIPGLYFDNTQTNAGLEFTLPTGGRVGIVAGYKMLANRYAVRVTMDDVHTNVILPLVQDYLNISGLGAVINGQIHVDGSFENMMNMQVQGALSMTGLRLRDMEYNELAALDELRVVLDTIDLNTNSFILDTLAITGITGEYEVHKNWNTLSKLLKEHEAKEDDEPEVSNDTTVSVNEEEQQPITWMAKKVILNGHDLKYSDYSMPNKWSYAIKTLDVEGENVANNGRNNIHLNATLTGNAKLKADFVGGLDMKQEDTRMTMSLTGVRLTDFDAICRNYTSYPLEGGVLSIQSKMDVKRAKMNGNNHIEIDQPAVGMKDLSSDAPYKNIPLQLGFKMLTSAQNMILLDVPVEGDVSNPQFSFRKVIGRALGKVFFGPLMGAGDKRKSKLTEEEMQEMQMLMGDD